MKREERKITALRGFSEKERSKAAKAIEVESAFRLAENSVVKRFTTLFSADGYL